MVKTIDFSHSHVLVAGDVMLDRYWYGDTTRISPEAPVPVVHVRNVKEAPGGAANVALNITSLGAHSTLLSIIGDDQDGRILEDLLYQHGIDSVLLRDCTLPTTVKLRLIAQQQQIVRADFEERPDHEMMLPMIDSFCERVSSTMAVIFSDYGKGGLTHLRQMMDCATKNNVPVLIDPKGVDYSVYHGATTITPNSDEFERVVGHWSNEADFEQRAFTLRDRLELDFLLVTRSEKGMSLFLDSEHIHIPTQARDVFDVSGAGDTVIATMATAMAAGHDIESAARIANTAAGIVVGKSGTMPITIQELLSHL